MATKKKLLQAAAGSAGGAGGLDVSEVFSTYLYEGNSSTQTITNGIDLSGEGGMVWIKGRTGTVSHALYDTERGANSLGLSSNTTSAASTVSGYDFESFNSNGFTVTAVGGALYNYTNDNRPFASWTFRKAPKFFDVVTYTGNGSAGLTIDHNLGSVPGCIIVKRTDSTGPWQVYHIGSDTTAPEDYYLELNATGARADNVSRWNDTAPTSTQFTLGTNHDVNQSGGTYVAYLFAHNDGDGTFGPTGDQDIIKCGSYSGSTTVDLGFEPQWILRKRTDSTGNWALLDTMRGWGPFSSSHEFDYLLANTSGAEATSYGQVPTATGFTTSSTGDFIYIAIRRGPMAVPTDATKVFAIDDKGEGGTTVTDPAHNSGFVADMALRKQVDSASDWFNGARLISGKWLKTNLSAAETGTTQPVWDYMDGFREVAAANTNDLAWMWKRAPNYFDVVAYTGNGTAGRTVSHNLGVAPEMIWTKARQSTTDNSWVVYHKDFPSKRLSLDSAGFSTGTNYTSLTSTSVTLADNTTNNTVDYISYFFASLSGVSKVGSFTGNGTSQTIDCGFTSGARFVLIKRASGGAGNWYIWDTSRGIVTGNDPHLKLNNTSAEVTTDDSIDPEPSGFTINQNSATDINISGSSYIFYAIA